MGGTYTHKTFESVEELVKFIQEQLEVAEKMGLYLLSGTITQRDNLSPRFEWVAYYSK